MPNYEPLPPPEEMETHPAFPMFLEGAFHADDSEGGGLSSGWQLPIEATFGFTPNVATGFALHASSLMRQLKEELDHDLSKLNNGDDLQ